MSVVTPSSVTKPFQTYWTANTEDSNIRAIAAVHDTAAGFGVTASDVTTTVAMLESLPPKGYVRGNIIGPSLAVDAAIEAIKQLDL